MKKTKYNPERRTWKGRSYKNGGKRVKDLKDEAREKTVSEKSEKQVGE